MFIRFKRVEYIEAKNKAVFIIQPLQDQLAIHLQSELISENLGDLRKPAGMLHFLNAMYPKFKVNTIEIRYRSKIIRKIHVLEQKTPFTRFPGIYKESSDLLVQHPLSIYKNKRLHQRERICTLPVGTHITVMEESAPLWLRVKAASGAQGYLPVHHSFHEHKNLITHDYPHHYLRASTFSELLHNAQMYLGTPLIWGHDRSKGDLGFDPFTFVIHVLRRTFRVKIEKAGELFVLGKAVEIPTASLLPGDLLFFENGKHLGIYTGANTMISAGGGTGIVGYINIQNNRFNRSNLTMVRRLF